MVKDRIGWNVNVLNRKYIYIYVDIDRWIDIHFLSPDLLSGSAHPCSHAYGISSCSLFKSSLLRSV